MKKLRMALACMVASAAGAADAATLFLGAYPNSLLVVEDSKGAVTQHIPLATGLPTSMRLSNDKKRLYVTTITTSGIEVIDVATRKVINSFSLNTPTTRYRFFGGAPDPTGRYFYTQLTQIDKGVDRYEISKPKYAVIDLKEKKIARMVDVAKEEDNPRSGGGGRRGAMFVSADGKSLYLFRDKVIVLDTSDFKVIERLDLAKPEVAGLESASFGPSLESLARPNQYVSLFNASDPYIHNKQFGIGRFDLGTRAFDFTPIGPAPTGMAGLEVTADGKKAYTVVTNGTLGNKRCEFWRFDLPSNTVEDKAEFQCRSRFSFGISADGQKLYIHGASFDIEVYDAQTLKLENTWDLGNDVTGAGLIVAQ